MDNLPAHKLKTVRDIIESEGAFLFYLPPYSPDLNPIEMAFSKIKALLIKAAARTIDDLHSAIKNILGNLKKEEAENYIRHAGYNSI